MIRLTEWKKTEWIDWDSFLLKQKNYELIESLKNSQHFFLTGDF